MTYNTEAMREAIVQKLRLNYGCTEKQANEAEMMKACALVLRDIMAERGVRTKAQVIRDEKRKVHYMSLEFLMGRSLVKNAVAAAYRITNMTMIINEGEKDRSDGKTRHR